MDGNFGTGRWTEKEARAPKSLKVVKSAKLHKMSKLFQTIPKLCHAHVPKLPHTYIIITAVLKINV